MFTVEYRKKSLWDAFIQNKQIQFLLLTILIKYSIFKTLKPLIRSTISNETILFFVVEWRCIYCTKNTSTNSFIISLKLKNWTQFIVTPCQHCNIDTIVWWASSSNFLSLCKSHSNYLTRHYKSKIKISKTPFPSCVTSQLVLTFK